MKTLREYIDLIDGKVTESSVTKSRVTEDSATAEIVKSIMNLFAPGLAQPLGGGNPKGLVAETDPETKSLVDFTDSDKYDNFVPPDEDEAEDYKSGVKGHKKIKDSDVYRRNGFSDAAVGGLVGSE
jgi:hypothetical protein